MPAIQCRNCGKVIEIRPDDGGALFVCVACGTRNESPMTGQDGAAWTAMRRAVEEDAARWKGIAPKDEARKEVEVVSVALVAAAAAEAAPTSAPAAVPRKERFGSPLAWALGVVLVTLAIVLPFAIAKFNEPKKADYSDLMEMQRKAEALAASGDLDGSHEAYGVLFDKANERAVDDPLVLERLAK